MAKAPGTEQPADGLDEVSDDEVSDDEVTTSAKAAGAEGGDGPGPPAWPIQAQTPQGAVQDQPWPTTEDDAEQDETSDEDATEDSDWPAEDFEDGPEDDHPGNEQIRRTDADRWAATFANMGGQGQGQGQPDSPSGQGGVTNGPAEGGATGAPAPTWSDRVPVPPASGPAWRTDVPAQPWTTGGPSGSGWGPEGMAAAHGGPANPAGQQSAPDYDADESGELTQSMAARRRTEHALPSNPLPPTGYPSPPPPPYGGPPPAWSGNDQAAGQPYGNFTQQGYQPGPSQQPPAQQAGPPPGSQSGWAGQVNQPYPVAPQQWQPQQGGQQNWQPGGQRGGPAVQQGPPQQQHTSAADLTSGSLVRPAAAVPKAGWRKMVHAVTGGAVNPGPSQAELTRRTLIERATAPVRGCHRIAVVSLKGGIGKTTTTAGLGLTLAEHRGDRVVALDANPDAGTLAERLTGQVDVTVRDLLDNVDSIRSFTDVSAFTSLAARLQVLASEQDPEMSEAFSEEEYRTVSDVLARYFNIFLTDSGTGLLHSAMSGTLALADSLVVVGSPSVDGASRASKTLDWLIAHGHGELVSRSVAVISTVRPATKELDMVRLREHFTNRARAVVEIPYDRHLVTGGIIDRNQLDGPTEHAFLELAATVADGFRFPPLNRPKAD